MAAKIETTDKAREFDFSRPSDSSMWIFYLTYPMEFLTLKS